MAQLQLDAAQIDRARASARKIAHQVFDGMHRRTTTTVERATLRLFGVDGVDENAVPLPHGHGVCTFTRAPSQITGADTPSIGMIAPDT